MTSLVAPHNDAQSRDTARLDLCAGLALAAVVASAALLQVRFGTATDVSWLITLAERVLDGQTPYVDFIEANPPLSIYIYVAPVALARIVGVDPEFMVALAGFVAAGCSLTVCAALLAPMRPSAATAQQGFALAAATLLLLPAGAFNQRDHIAVIAGLPMFALVVALVQGQRTHWALSALAGVGGGLMIAIRPHYGLAAAPALAYLALTRGVPTLLRCVAFYAAGATIALYGAIVLLAFPQFAATTMPLVASVYLPVRAPLTRLLLDPGVVAWVALAAALAATGVQRWREPIALVPALASCGALASFFLQGKGWPYHIYPALALISLAAGFALRDRLRQPRFALTASAGAVAAAAGAELDGRWPFHVLAVLAFGVLALAIPPKAAGGSLLPRWREKLIGAVVGGALGVGFIWLAGEAKNQTALEDALIRLGPHPTVVAISGNIAVGHPLVRRVGGRWAQRVCSLWITAGADRLLAAFAGDAVQRERLEAYRREDRDRLVEDVVFGKPDAILVNTSNPTLAGGVAGDPDIAAALANYRLFAQSEDSDGPTALYARRDLVDLRPRLGEAPAAAQIGLSSGSGPP